MDWLLGAEEAAFFMSVAEMHRFRKKPRKHDERKRGIFRGRGNND
jgi:hypothetical protein